MQTVLKSATSGIHPEHLRQNVLVDVQGLAQDLAAGRLDVAVDSYGTGKYAQGKGAYQGIQIEIAKPDARVPVAARCCPTCLWPKSACCSWRSTTGCARR